MPWMDCISVENMRQSDAYTIANHVPSLELMHRAAYGVYLAADWHGHIGILVGSGNNGGDGFALACILRARGHTCSVYTLSERLSPDSAYYAQKACAAGVPVQPFAPGCLAGCGVLVDCLLGTGFQGAPRPDYAAAIRAINAADAFVVSVDINSGMNGDTGQVQLAVRSDLTVTIGYVKKGLVQPQAGAYIGRLVCADIGITLRQREQRLCDAAAWAALAEPKPADGLPAPPWLDMTVIKTC